VDPVLGLDWNEDALEPATGPDPSGEWLLNRLRWTLLGAALRAPPSARLAAHFPRVAGAVAASGLGGPVPLAPHHVTDSFDCGVELLDKLLRKTAAELARDGETRLATRVITSGDLVAGYYSTRRIFAVSKDDPAKRIPLIFVARSGVDRRWRRLGVADDMFLQMLREAWNVPEGDRPAALVGIAVGPAAKRFFRRIGIRPLGDAIHVRGVIVPGSDLAAAAAFSMPDGVPAHAP
jgi:GNAT superfamily N-acetyltransferase